jgi:hypothetical protein
MKNIHSMLRAFREGKMSTDFIFFNDVAGLQHEYDQFGLIDDYIDRLFNERNEDGSCKDNRSMIAHSYKELDAVNDRIDSLRLQLHRKINLDKVWDTFSVQISLTREGQAIQLPTFEIQGTRTDVKGKIEDIMQLIAADSYSYIATSESSCISV